MKYCKAQKWRSDDPADRDIIEALPKQTHRSNHMKSMDYREVGSFLNTAYAEIPANAIPAI